METKEKITTVNYHLVKGCNYGCKFCFANFNDVKQPIHYCEQKRMIKLISKQKHVKKINFVGGEPTLMGERLVKLVKYAKRCNLLTSVTTNGSLIDRQWIKDLSGALDILTISIDSADDETNRLSGRCGKNGVLPTLEHYRELAQACHEVGVNLKINTVVSKFNKDENLAQFINELMPMRWKIFQALRIEGENSQCFDACEVSDKDYEEYCKRQLSTVFNRDIVVVETNELMRGSYLMINPEGRFFDNTNGGYTVSDKIIEVGFEVALSQINYSAEKFVKRNGEYDISKNTIGLYEKSAHFCVRQKERGISDRDVDIVLRNLTCTYLCTVLIIVGKPFMKANDIRSTKNNLVIVLCVRRLVTTFYCDNLFELKQQGKMVLI